MLVLGEFHSGRVTSGDGREQGYNDVGGCVGCVEVLPSLCAPSLRASSSSLLDGSDEDLHLSGL